MAGVARRQAFDVIDAELRAIYDEAGSKVERPPLTVGARGQLWGELVLYIELSRPGGMIRLEDWANENLQIQQIACALAAYRLEQGTYPDTLEALVPNWFNSVPVDATNGLPLVYRRDGEGYVLYSLGLNGTDDEGSNYGTDFWKGHSILFEEQTDIRALMGIPARIERDEDENVVLEGDELENPANFWLYELTSEDADDVSIRLPLPTRTRLFSEEAY
jgi:hypothetical protein